jgi:hypothetical protein
LNLSLLSGLPGRFARRLSTLRTQILRGESVLEPTTLPLSLAPE